MTTHSDLTRLTDIRKAPACLAFGRIDKLFARRRAERESEAASPARSMAAVQSDPIACRRSKRQDPMEMRNIQPPRPDRTLPREEELVPSRTEARDAVLSPVRPASKLSPASVLAMQRLAGNRAVQRVLAPDRVPPRSDPWRKRYDKATALPMRWENVQRQKSSDGWFSKKVKFESSAFAAPVGGALKVTKDGTDLTLGSQDYRPTGTVRATGPKDQVEKYKVGWLQTLRSSNITYWYSPEPYKAGWGAKIVPRLLGGRRKVTTAAEPQPIRDGDAGVTPWYEIGDCLAFGNSPDSTKTVSMYDAPENPDPWTITVDGADQYLVKTSGQDVFRTWLVTRNEDNESITRLNYADWTLDYGTTVTPNPANMGASAVAPTADSGSTVSVSEGAGFRSPELGDPVANDSLDQKTTKW